MKLQLFILSLLPLFAAPAWAQEDGEDSPDTVLPPPEIPDPLRSGQAIEPEVTIIRRDDAVIEEYRINGHLYMVKITPSVGQPYYLIDRDGDGRMERRSGKLESGTVPQWVIFSW